MNSDGAMPNEDEKREKRERGREGRSIASISLFLSLPSADLPTSHRFASPARQKGAFHSSSSSSSFFLSSGRSVLFGLWVILSALLPFFAPPSGSALPPPGYATQRRPKPMKTFFQRGDTARARPHSLSEFVLERCSVLLTDISEISQGGVDGKVDYKKKNSTAALVRDCNATESIQRISCQNRRAKTKY